MVRTCAEAYVETMRSILAWPWTAETLVRYALGDDEGRGVLVSELIGDEDGPEEDA